MPCFNIKQYIRIRFYLSLKWQPIYNHIWPLWRYRTIYIYIQYIPLSAILWRCHKQINHFWLNFQSTSASVENLANRHICPTPHWGTHEARYEHIERNTCLECAIWIETEGMASPMSREKGWQKEIDKMRVFLTEGCMWAKMLNKYRTTQKSPDWGVAKWLLLSARDTSCIPG